VAGHLSRMPPPTAFYMALGYTPAWPAGTDRPGFLLVVAEQASSSNRSVVDRVLRRGTLW
jgi:hypothetical protein